MTEIEIIMEILNKRAYATRKSTLGCLVVDGEPFGFVIEDEPREVKVKGHTRAPIVANTSLHAPLRNYNDKTIN